MPNSPAIRAQEESSGHGITFTKDFPGSVPAYYSVAVRESGEAVYKTEPKDEQPIEFRLPAEVTSELFSLAGKLSEAPDWPLESKRRVANMGEKTIEYRDGAEPFTASFNHTEVPEALALMFLALALRAWLDKARCDERGDSLGAARGVSCQTRHTGSCIHRDLRIRVE